MKGESTAVTLPQEQSPRKYYLQQIRELCDPTVIYKDGSATCGTMKDRTAIVVSEGDPATPNFAHSEQRKVRCILVAMRRRLR